MLDTNELERLSLRTRKAVARLVVGELVLVIWVFEETIVKEGVVGVLFSLGG